MRTPTLVTIVAAGIATLLAHAPPAQPRRIGPAEIYPDPVRTPGAANPQVAQRNIRDTPFLLLACWGCVYDNGIRIRE
jgi:hypothetical protein